MKRYKILVLATLMVVFSVVGCRSTVKATIDIASSKNFRCEVYQSYNDEAYTLGENDAVYFFKQCFEKKDNADKLKGNQVGVGADYIKLYFVGDCVDNAPIKDGKADYSGFIIFSNNVVRFEYDNKSEYYQFENAFYNFINNLLIFHKAKSTEQNPCLFLYRLNVQLVIADWGGGFRVSF